MKLIKREDQKIVIEMEGKEFDDVVSAVALVYNCYEGFDQVMLDVPEDRLEQLYRDILDVLDASVRSRKASPAPSYVEAE